MNPITRIARLVAWRLTVNRSLNIFLRGCFYVLCLFAALALIDRLIYLGFSPYLSMGLGLLAMLPVACLGGLLRPVGLEQAALAIDERLGLHERLSSALDIRGSSEPAVEAVLMDAQRHAEAINPREHFPYQYPRESRYLPFPAVAVFLLWSVVPSFDLLKREAEVVEQAKLKKHLAIEAQELTKRTRELRKKMAEIKSVKTQNLIKQIEKVSEELKAAKDKKEAFLKLSEIGDKLKDRQEELKKLAESRQRFQPNSMNKMTKQLEEALAQGDYEAAKRQMQKLAEELKEMLQDPEKNKEQLEQMARELGKLAKDLKQLGIEDLPESLKSAASKLSSVDPQELQEALDDLEDAQEELAQLEQLMDEMEMIEMALDELDTAKDSMCEKGCLVRRRRGALSSRRGGMRGSCPGPGGGSGRGSGLRDRGGLDSANFEKSRVKGQIGKGPILGAFLIKGLPPKGESNVGYQDAVTNYKAAAEEALDKERIPANYRDLVRDYFDAIENPVVGVEATGPKE